MVHIASVTLWSLFGWLQEDLWTFPAASLRSLKAHGHPQAAESTKLCTADRSGHDFQVSGLPAGLEVVKKSRACSAELSLVLSWYLLPRNPWENIETGCCFSSDVISLLFFVFKLLGRTLVYLLNNIIRHVIASNRFCERKWLMILGTSP